MRLLVLYLLAFGILEACQKSDQPKSNDSIAVKDSIIYLQNETSKLGINLYGGAFIDFQRSENDINPLTWQLTKEQMPANNKNGAVFQGHFLCLGRWGQPSPGEMAAGIPHNGEPANTWWKLMEKSGQQLTMSNVAPLDGLAIQRKITLHEIYPVFKVAETIKNELSIGRIYNIVQHATLGPPFLDTAMTVYSNAGKGFLQVNAFPHPEQLDYHWPIASNDSLDHTVNLNATQDVNYVTTHIFPDHATTGWIAAYSPTHQLLFGYLWPLTDYPWLNVWNHFENGEPVAKGLEFGTTGIGTGYEKLLATDTRFYGHNSFEYIDAGESKEKIFYGFIVNVPDQIHVVNKIELEEGILKIQTDNEQSLTSYDINLIL